MLEKHASGNGNLKKQLAQLIGVSLGKTLPTHLYDCTHPLIASSISKFGDYQCNNAMGVFFKLRETNGQYQNPRTVREAIMKNLPFSELIKSASVAGPGFVNVVLSNNWMAQRIQKLLVDGIETWAPNLSVKRVVVDFSSPNIAKELHAGHLRSTIIGDTLARMLEFSKVQVLRQNHVGDWGTQFGMLIEFLFERFPNPEDINGSAIDDLQAFYKASKQRFAIDSEFRREDRELLSTSRVENPSTIEPGLRYVILAGESLLWFINALGFN